MAMTHGSPNPVDQKGLCLLSLDGGGVRGLSSLLILQALMARVNDERRKEDQPDVKPCELFDMIGGTSTGGIIAIMLGRLEMSVDECIDAYSSMFEAIFSKKGLPVNIKGKVQGRFDSAVLEKCVKDIMKSRGLPETEPLNDGNEGRCKVFVCAKAAEITTTVLLRSYTSMDALNNIPATICEAVRATSAATSFFDPAIIGPRKRKFVDGALGANNPAEQMWNEAQTKWCSGDVELRDMLKCFVSVGTGNPGLTPVAEGVLAFLSGTLVSIATQTEDTAKVFAERHRRLLETKRYFRFNVQQGLQGVGLEEYRKEALIDSATAEYMNEQQTKLAVQECATNLRQKQLYYQLLSTEIEERTAVYATSTHTQPRYTVLPYPRNEAFVGRDEAFNELDRLLPEDSKYHTAALCGLGGCGKTQIALEYAFRRQNRTACSVFWVRGDSDASFNQSYSNIARTVGLPTHLKGSDLLDATRQWMEQQPGWLLVLDNVDDVGLFKHSYSNQQSKIQASSPELLDFVPRLGGTILWTSRDKAILGQLIDVTRGVEIDSMTDQEALELFQTRSQAPLTLQPSPSEKELLNLLQKLPLAIAQAAAYIGATKVSVEYYLRAFQASEDRQSKLLSQEFSDVHRSKVPNSVMQTWLISIDQIAQESPCGEKLLKTIAFVDNQGIPFQLLKTIAGDEFDEDDVLLAASRLTAYSFLQAQVTVEDDFLLYHEHRLVQLVTRQTLSPSQANSYSGAALAVMADLFPNGTYETWSTCRLYLPHPLKAVARPTADNYNDQAPSLLGYIGRYYWEQGRSNEAERLQVEVLELRKSVLGEKHPNTIRAMANLASTWWQQGRSDEAERLQFEVLELQKSMLGEKYPDTILTMANLASTWYQQGRSDKAERLQVEVLELRKSVLGEKHPNTIRAMANLASTWWQQGRSDEAERLEVEVLELQKSVLSEKHPNTIRAMANLASTWQQQGRSDEAERLQFEVLELQKSVLGEKHPDTILTMANLASTWYQQGRSDKAERLQVEVLELQKSVLGEKHPNTILAMASLASTWYQQGRSDEAERLEVEVLKLQKSILGEKLHNTILAMASLASAWQQQGRSDEAERLKLEVLELQKSILGEKHPNTILAMVSLASTWQQQGRSDKAERQEVKVLELQKSVLGEKHPDTLRPMADLDTLRQN